MENTGFMRHLWLTALLLSGLAPSAWASTVPRVDFAPHQRLVGVGVGPTWLDGNVDVALGDRVTLGFVGVRGLANYAAALRSTYQLGETGPFTYGLTLSGGYFTNYRTEGPWVQLALNGAWRVAPWMTLRATLGPVWQTQEVFGFKSGEWIPNLEAAVPMGENGEWTLGGYGITGLRWVF